MSIIIIINIINIETYLNKNKKNSNEKNWRACINIPLWNFDTDHLLSHRKREKNQNFKSRRRFLCFLFCSVFYFSLFKKLAKCEVILGLDTAQKKTWSKIGRYLSWDHQNWREIS